MPVRYRADRDRWVAEVNWQDPKTGKSKPQRESFKTKEEAEARLEQMQIEKGLSVIREHGPNDPVSYRQAATHCTIGNLIEICKQKDWNDNRSEDAQSRARQIAKHFGVGHDVRTMNEHVLREFFEVELRSWQGKKGRPLSVVTIKKYKSTMAKMLRRAEKERWITEVPKMDYELKVKRPFSRHVFQDGEDCPDWEGMFLDYFKERAQYTEDLGWMVSHDIFRFLLHTGCRIGEALDLEWHHVNLAANQGVFIETKDGAKPRIFGIPAICKDDLPRWKEYAKTFGRGKDYSQRVFPSTTHKFRNHFTEAKWEVCPRLGWVPSQIETMTPHTLRHMSVTRDFERTDNISLVMQKHGHTRLETANRYLHQRGNNVVNFMIS